MGLRRRPGVGRRLDGRDNRQLCVADRRRSHDEPTSGPPPPCGSQGRSGCLRAHRQVSRRTSHWVPGRPGGHGRVFSAYGFRPHAPRRRSSASTRSRVVKSTMATVRSMDQLRADTFLDLLEGVRIGSSPVHRSGVVELTVPWTTVTGAANDPGVLAGYGPIDADTARDIIGFGGRARDHVAPRHDDAMAEHSHRRRRSPAEYQVPADKRGSAAARTSSRRDGRRARSRLRSRPRRMTRRSVRPAPNSHDGLRPATAHAVLPGAGSRLVPPTSTTRSTMLRVV